MTSNLFSGPRLYPPHKAQHIGSLLRPAELIKKRAEFSGGKCTEQDLKEVELKAISAIVNMQREIGLKVMTDGEFSRYFFDSRAVKATTLTPLRQIFYEGVFDSLQGQELDESGLLYLSP
jgi:hypothetical protein